MRKALGEMMRRLGEQGGEMPQPLQRAERAMRGAGDALNKGKPSDAIGPQSEALDQLQQGGAPHGQRMIGRTITAQNDDGEPDDQGRDQAKRDPFGRQPNDQRRGLGRRWRPMRLGTAPSDIALTWPRRFSTSCAAAPASASRPDIERDYIDRLLKEF